MVQTLNGQSLEERVARLHELRSQISIDQLKEFERRLDLSWVYHDSALEGVVYTFDELEPAMSDHVVSDSSLLPTFDEIRHHRAALALIRDLAEKKRVAINLELLRKIHFTLEPEATDGKGAPRYRKDIPLHRLYFHEICPPEKIAGQMRQLIQWINSNETRRSTHTVRLAAKAHYKLLHTYPYPKNSGKVARLMMNLILMRHGYPPALIHATERQRYYDALKTSEDQTAKLVAEALAASVESTIRHFEQNLGLATVA